MNCVEMIESLFDLLSRNRCGVFFNLPFSLPPPCDEQKSNRMTSKVQGRRRCWCPLWLDRGQHQQLRFYGDQWQPKHQLLRCCRKEGTLSLKFWERITCQPCSLPLAIGCKKQNFPLFLVCVNCKGEKSLLKVICNKQQRMKVPDSCGRSQRIFKFWHQRNACVEY